MPSTIVPTMLRKMSGLVTSSTLKAVRNMSPALFQRLHTGIPVASSEEDTGARLRGSQVTWYDVAEPAIPKYNNEAIPAHMMDIMLTDITEAGLKKAAKSLGVKNLARATFPACPFPVKGLVYGLNLRLMVNLVCGFEDRRPVNVVFLVDTGSAPSYITPCSIDALLGSKGGYISDEQMNVCVQSSRLVVPMDTTPQDSHFPDANVLGMAALKELNLSIEIDYKFNAFRLVPNTWRVDESGFDQFQERGGGGEVSVAVKKIWHRLIGIWRSEYTEPLTKEAKAQGKIRATYVGERLRADKSELEGKVAAEVVQFKHESLEAEQRRIHESKTEGKAESLDKHNTKPGRL